MEMTPQEFIEPDLQGCLGIVSLIDWSGDVRVNDLEKWESIRPLACAQLSYIMVIGRHKDTSDEEPAIEIENKKAL